MANYSMNEKRMKFTCLDFIPLKNELLNEKFQTKITFLRENAKQIQGIRPNQQWKNVRFSNQTYLKNWIDALFSSKKPKPTNKSQTFLIR